MSASESEARSWRQARLACALIAVGCIAGIATPAGIGWDFANFYDTGRRVAAGQLADIYDASTHVAGAPPSTTLDFYGAPISAFLYAPLGWLAPNAALVAFKLEGTLALWAALFLLYRFGRRQVGTAPGAAARYAARFAWAALLFQPFWTIYRVGGQTTPIAFLLLTIGLLAHVRGRVAWSSLCFALVVLIKPAFVLGAVFLGLIAGVRFVLLGALHAGWLGALSVAALGWPIHQDFLSKMGANAGGIARWTYNSSIWSVPSEISWWLAGPSAASAALPRALTLGLQLAIAAGMGWLAWWTRRRLPAPARAHHEWILAMTFFLLFAQTAWEHYLSVLFFPVAFWLASWDDAPRPVGCGIAALVGLSMTQNLIFTRALAGILPADSLPVLLGVTLVKSAPTLVVVWLLARHRQSWEATYQKTSWRPM